MISFVSVVITHHLNENQDYLDLCLKSLEKKQQPNSEYEVIVIAGSKGPPICPPWVRLYWEPKYETYAQKMNYGVSLASDKATHVITGQDDLLFGRDCIDGLLEVAQDYGILLNPIGTCDQDIFFKARFKFGNKILPRFFKKELIAGLEDEIMDYKPNCPVMFTTQVAYLYCTLIPIALWRSIGGLDETYRNGVEDTDFCMAAKAKGIPAMVTPNAFCIHFGGQTSGQMDLTETHKLNYSHFKQKWGFDLAEYYSK